jgi:hypothetical protein
MSRSTLSLGLAALVASLITAPAPAPAADPTPILRLTATASNIASARRYIPTRLEIVFERWSTPEENQQLTQTLTTKGSDALLDVLQSMKPRAGYIRTDASLGWRIQYAQQTPMKGGGTRVFFATDRPMGFDETGSGARSTLYEFTVGEIHLDDQGKGDGRLVPAARISYDEGEKAIEIENYQNAPYSLEAVSVVPEK